MKIQRTVTFNVTEDEIRNFFGEDWWQDATKVGDDEFKEFQDVLVENDDYCDEEWNFVGDSKEVITKIWQEELEKVKKNVRLEKLIKQLAYFQQEMKKTKKHIEWLKKVIADAE